MALIGIGGKKGDGPTFEQPFEMMQACHERLYRTLALLGKLRAHLPQHGADEQAQQAARDIVKYFDQAAPNHHRDEELHVFPPLLAQGEAVEVVRQLQREHVEMEEQWPAVRDLLGRVAAGEPGALTAAQEDTLQRFASLYESHIAAEESIAYPAAQKLLDAPAVAAMGQEMQSRRQMR